MNIRISLPQDRTKLGTLTVWDGLVAAGPFPCDGKSDNAAAIAANNPTRNPEQPLGDTPLGEYTGQLGSEADSAANRRSYGPADASGLIPVIWLNPQPDNSQAWRAHLNKRAGLAIHCGDLNGAGGLRPTHGCIRLSNDDFAAMLAALGPGHSWQVSISQTEKEN